MQLARAVELVDMFMGHVGYTRFPSNMVTQGHFEDKVGAITPHGGIVVLVDDGASPYHSIQPRLGALHKTFVVSDAIRQRRTLITNTLIGDRFQRSLRGTLLERCYRCSAEGGGLRGRADTIRPHIRSEQSAVPRLSWHSRPTAPDNRRGIARGRG